MCHVEPGPDRAGFGLRAHVLSQPHSDDCMLRTTVNVVGRDIKTIQWWEADDEEFRTEMLRAKATFPSRTIARSDSATYCQSLT